MVPSDHFFSVGKKNWEPRLGLAWRLDESGKTVVRAAGGLYHNRMNPAFASIGLLEMNGNSVRFATNGQGKGPSARAA